MKRILFWAGLLLAALCLPLSGTATNIGYTNGDYGRSYVFRLGTTTKQGMAFKLDTEKLKMLKGQTIGSIEAVFGSRNSTNNGARLFISTSLEADPLLEQDVTISKAVQWLTYELDQPYTITGDEGSLYIGYTVEIANTYSALSSDYSADVKDKCFAYMNGVWTDIYGMGFGCVNVRAVLDGDFTFTDLALKPFSVDGYYKIGQSYSLSGQLFNFGSEPIHSFDVSVKIGEGDPVVYKYDNVNIAANGVLDVVLPEFSASTSGEMPMNVVVANVNGTTDFDISDNVFLSDLFFYPSEMEKCMLVEGFTGQDCSNCPAGHRAIASAIAATDLPIAEIIHHAGYSPDIFSMDADDYYTFFYGSGTTYAPAVMVNRAVNPQIGSVPVINTTENNVLNTLNLLANRQPYASLKLTSDYNPETRESKIRLVIYMNNALPEGTNLFNVALVQDDIKAYQSMGGSEYSHTMVFRGTLTNNAWGITIPENMSAQGDSVVWETTYVLPEAIYSDYWTPSLMAAAGKTVDDLTIPTDPDKMYLVAYVGAFDMDDEAGNEVYNSVQVKLGESYTQGGVTGISSVDARRPADISVKSEGGRIVVSGDYDSYTVYNIAGRRVSPDSRLGRGIYIVNVKAGDRAVTKKITVR